MKNVFLILEKNSEGDVEILFAVFSKAEVKAALEKLKKSGLQSSEYFFRRVEVR